MTKAWINIDPNIILKVDGFFISYNPGNFGLSIFSSDDGGDETAIVKDGRYYILNGDHREQYEKLVDDGFGACMKYFEANNKLKSSWSN